MNVHRMPETGQMTGFLVTLVIMHLIGNGNYAQTGGELFLLGLPKIDKALTVELIIVNQRDQAANVTLKCPGADVELNYEVDTVLRVTLPDTWLASNSGRDNKGITIATNYDVTVYCIYKNGTEVKTIFSVLPVSDLIQPEYYVISPSSTTSEEDRLTLTALESSTRVWLSRKLGTAISFVSNGIQYFTSSHSLVLDAFETITIVGNLSLDGVKISSDHPVAAVLLKAENNSVSLEQLHPTALWGSAFHAPNVEDLNGSLYESIFSITAVFNNTTVQMWDSRQSSHTLNEGQTEDFSILWNETLVINSTQPIMVKHYIRGTSTNISKQLWAVPPDDRNFYKFKFPSVNFVFNSNGTESVKVVTNKVNTDGMLLDNTAMGCSWLDFNDQGASTCTQDVSSQKTVHTTLHRHNNMTSPQLTYTYAICDYSELCALPSQWGRVMKTCVLSVMRMGDGLDNDCDGYIDEELEDGIDNDGDGLVDEDTGPDITTTGPPTTTTLKPTKRVVYSTYNDDDDDMVMRNFPALVTAIIASLSAAVLLVIVCILGFVIAECQCNSGTLRNSKILPFVG